MRTIIYPLLLALSSNATFSAATQQIIFFDLGGVLIKEAETNLEKVLPDHLKMVHRNNNNKIFNRIMEFAELVSAGSKRQWLLGTLTSKDFVTTISKNIDATKHQSFFKNSQEKELMRYASPMILLPELLVMLCELDSDGLNFIKKCKLHNIKIGIISNWDPQSFALLKEKFPELFLLIDTKHIHICSTANALKPQAEIYEQAVKSSGCAVKNIYFVDDNKNNVAGAQQASIKSVHHTSWQQTATELKKLGLFINQ